MPILIILSIALVIGLIITSLYNGLIRKKNQVDNAFSSVDVMLKKRHDLLPNLVSIVQNYMNYEKNLLTDVTELRAKANSGQISDHERIDVENKITKAVGNIMLTAESYPDLKANQNFMQLQASWNEQEEQISAARRSYNAAVNDYNNAVMMFPSNIVANMMNYKTKIFFETPVIERENINAKDLFKQQ